MCASCIPRRSRSLQRHRRREKRPLLARHRSNLRQHPPPSPVCLFPLRCVPPTRYSCCRSLCTLDFVRACCSKPAAATTPSSLPVSTRGDLLPVCVCLPPLAPLRPRRYTSCRPCCNGFRHSRRPSSSSASGSPHTERCPSSHAATSRRVGPLRGALRLSSWLCSTQWDWLSSHMSGTR